MKSQIPIFVRKKQQKNKKKQKKKQKKKKKKNGKHFYMLSAEKKIWIKSQIPIFARKKQTENIFTCRLQILFPIRQLHDGNDDFKLMTFQPIRPNKIVCAVLALREVWELETPKNCPGTSKNQCQEVWNSQLLKIFSHL